MADNKSSYSDSRRREIIDTAMVLFDQNGYSKTKMSDISKACGISKGLIYYYFESKGDLVLAVIDRIEECLNYCKSIEDARESIDLFVLRFLSYPYYDDYVPPMRVLFTVLIRGEIELDDEKNPIKEDFGKNYFGPIFKRGQDQGYFKDGDPYYFGDYFWKYLIGCLSLMDIGKKGKTYHPDVDEMLKIFKK